MTPDLDQWATIDAVAAVLKRPGRTIRNWAADGTIRRSLVQGVLHVHLGDASKQSATRSRRNRPRSDAPWSKVTTGTFTMP